MINDVDWNETDPRMKPVCIVGAGFQKAVLRPGLPSTDDIIKETVQNHEEQFPILSILINKKILPRFDLNYIWKNIEDLSSLLANDYSEIYSKYSKLNNKITEVIHKYKEYNESPQIIIWVVLGLELKMMLAYQYGSSKIKKNRYFEDAICKLKKIPSKDAKFTWISLNYDIVLEQMLLKYFGKIKYSFEYLLANNDFNVVDFKHLIVKPHGSLNIVFETYNQNSNGKENHRLYFKDKTNYLETFDCKEMGYDVNKCLFSWSEIQKDDNERFVKFLTQYFCIDWGKRAKIEKIDDQTIRVYIEHHSISLRLNDEETKIILRINNGITDELTVKRESGQLNIYQNIITEKRPWLIGYLPDYMKDELNSRACFSDLAHDLCKWNMASTSFALENASSIFILGYSMPSEDEWMWVRFKNIRKKDINIYVASRRSNIRIVRELKTIGFTNVNIINDGEI